MIIINSIVSAISIVQPTPLSFLSPLLLEGLILHIDIYCTVVMYFYAMCF